jgi:hypothetical protein
LAQPYLNSGTKTKCVACQEPLDKPEKTAVSSHSSATPIIAREGKTALLIALQFSGLPDVFRGAILLSSLVIPSALIPAYFWNQGMMATSTAMVAVMSVFLICLLWLSTLRTLLSKHALKTVVRRIQKSASLGQLKSTCPGCEQLLAAPGIDAAFVCPTCNIELLSSDGVIVSHAERQKNRVAAWTLRAKQLVDQDKLNRMHIDKRNQIVSKVIICLNILIPIAVLGLFIFGQPLAN